MSVSAITGPPSAAHCRSPPCNMRALRWPRYSSIHNSRAARMPVWVYTVNDPPAMREVIRYGVDGFETDVPRLAVEIARELGVRR